MTQSMHVEQAAARLLEAGQVLILCHKNPDGDTIGCGAALCHVLNGMGRQAAVLCADPIPPRLSFTRPRLFRGEFVPDLVVAVDVAGVALLGDAGLMPAYSRHVDLCIDHHAGNGGYADCTLLDASAAAAAELLWEVLQAMGAEITPLVADCLYTGLATDTGCFRFANTTARTHRVAAGLIEAGARVEELNTILFATRSRGQMEAERIARSHLTYELEGRCAVIWLDRDETAASGADPRRPGRADRPAHRHRRGAGGPDLPSAARRQLAGQHPHRQRGGRLRHRPASGRRRAPACRRL